MIAVEVHWGIVRGEHERVNNCGLTCYPSPMITAAILEALTDAQDPPTAERDSHSAIYVRAAHKMTYQSFDTRRSEPAWAGPRPYSGRWVRWCDAVDAALAELIAAGVVAVYVTPTCWAWDGLERGSVDGYWLTSRPEPKQACKPWSKLERVA